MFNTPSHPVPQYQVSQGACVTSSKPTTKPYRIKPVGKNVTSPKPITKPHRTKLIGKSITSKQHQRKKNLCPDRLGGQAVQAVKTKLAGPVGNAIARVARTPVQYKALPSTPVHCMALPPTPVRHNISLGHTWSKLACP